MVSLIIFAVILSTTSAGVIQNNQHQSSIRGSLKAHKLTASWDEAQSICQNEGSILASPIDVNVLADMKYLMDANHRYNTYYIGTKMRQFSGQFVSIEGVALDEMPVFDMLERLDLADGDCLAMDDQKISVVPCWTPLPYMCKFNRSECSAGYQRLSATGNCYKLHVELKNWDTARATCINEGGNLVVINDDTEAEYIKEWTLNEFEIAVGIQDRGNNSNWKSDDGTPVEQLYNEWVIGTTPKSSINKCVVFRTSGKLDDYYCPFQKPFLCEKESNYIHHS